MCRDYKISGNRCRTASNSSFDTRSKSFRIPEVELRSGDTMDFNPRGCQRLPWPVTAVARNRIQSIGDRKNPRAQRNRVASQFFGISLTIEALVVRMDDLRFQFEAGKSREQVQPQLRMHFHDCPLLVIQRAWFHQNVVRNSRFSNVMQPRTYSERPEGFGTQLQIACYQKSKGGDPL